jgi:hypothetical protein
LGFIILFSQVYMKYFDHILPPFTLTFHPFPSSWSLPQTVPPFYIPVIPLLVFLLGLDFTNEREHVIFVFLSLAYFI